MSDLIDAGKKFDDAVRATGVVGGIRADLANVQTDVTEIKADVKTLGGDVKAIKSTLDRYGGAIAISSAAISIAVTLVVSFFK